MKNNNASATKSPDGQANDDLRLLPHRLIHFWEMIAFFPYDIFEAIWELEAHAYSYQKFNLKEADLLIPRMLKCVERVHAHCCQYSLSSAQSRSEVFHNRLMHRIRWQMEKTERPISKDFIESSCADLIHSLRDEMKDKTFAHIEANRARYFEKANLFGKSVSDVFPSAQPEIKAAGNCLAAGLDTAAVFHLMRAAELGMREFGRLLQVTPLRENKPIFISDATWDELRKAINVRIESEEKLPKANRQIIKTGFRAYRMLAQQMDIFKDTRNQVMHTRDLYNESEAQGVFDRVKEFLQQLASKF